jgi:hypothetical protein
MEVLSIGIRVIELDEKSVPYQVWNADLHACPSCGDTVTTFFSKKSVPVREIPKLELIELIEMLAKGQAMFEYPTKDALEKSMPPTENVLGDLFRLF